MVVRAVKSTADVGKTTKPAGVRSLRSSRRIALTGANTFLGRGLISWFESSKRLEKVIAMDVGLPHEAGEKTSFLKLDLTQPDADAVMVERLRQEGIDTLLHLAFLSTPLHDTAWAHEFEAIGTLRVLAACAQCRIPKLIVKSHTTVYGAHRTNPNYLTEEHQVAGSRSSKWIEDKVEVENQVARFAADHPETAVTLLRNCVTLGPNVRNFMTRLLQHRFVPTALGYDPLMQFIHESDALAAFKTAVDKDCPGTFNITGKGVLPFSNVIRLTGRTGVPLLKIAAGPLLNFLWVTQMSRIPPGFFNFFKFPFVADGTKAEEVIGFRPKYTTRETVLNFAATLRPDAPPPSGPKQAME